MTSDSFAPTPTMASPAAGFTRAAWATTPPASAEVITMSPGAAQVLEPRAVRRIALAALICGIVGDLMADGELLGVGLSAYLISCIGTLAFTLAASGRTADRHARQRRLAMAVAALFAALLVIRDSETLQAFNMLAAFGALAVAVGCIPGSGFNLFAVTVRRLVLAGAQFVTDAIVGGLRFLLVDSVRLFSAGGDGDARQTAAIVRAGSIGVALTILFCALLSAGDPVFSSAFEWLGRLNAPRVTTHLFKTALFAWPALGVLWLVTRRVAVHTQSSVGAAAGPNAPTFIDNIVGQMMGMTGAPRALNRLDALVALGAMNVVFAAFLLSQLRTLFGGMSFVAETTGLTLAQYARSGFFALTFTSALVVGVLLALDFAMGDDGLAKWPVARRLAYTLLGLVGVVLVSAVSRMLLYVASFGITQDRVTALFIIAWLAVVLGMFARTILRGRPVRFVVSALGAGLATLLALNVINLDAIAMTSAWTHQRPSATATAIAVATATNAERSAIDALAIGADGVPTLTRLILASTDLGATGAPSSVAKPNATLESAATPSGVPGRGAARSGANPNTIVPFDVQCLSARALVKRWGTDAQFKPTQWTLGAWRARRAVRRNEAALAAVCPFVVAPVQQHPVSN